MLKYFLWEYTIFAAKNHIYRIFYGTKILAKNSASQKPSFPGMAEAQGSLTEHVLSVSLANKQQVFVMHTHM
jgi:hypothetical protein